MNTIKPGPELDRAVAEAVGWTHKICVGYRDEAGNDLDAAEAISAGCSLLAVRKLIYKTVDAKTGGKYIPRYSTDLNAAFEAAEKVGLFSETFWRTLGMDEFGETWGVFEQDGAVKKTVAGENHDTPALAICAAILKRRESGNL